MTEDLAEDAHRRIDALLAALLAEEPPDVAEALGPAIAGGKRLRPTVLLLVHDALGGGAPGRAEHWAAGIELLHAATLVHDDLVDGDDRRRGAPALHAQVGARLAVLAGDAAVAWGLSLLDPPAHDLAARALRDTWRAAWREAQARGPYEAVAAGKTAPLFGLAGALGAIAAGADDPARDVARAYGERLGLAYQLADDVADQPPGGPPAAELRRRALLAADETRALAAHLPAGPARAALEALPARVVARAMEAAP
ncbi:MAG TPA: polyprenyl synthetase family protein [Candidatus Thermoplasmatota archaeon]|nr:polyprenyl synthetase family protein [Candidatus Thermoplasmatota archaeon]